MGEDGAVESVQELGNQAVDTVQELGNALVDSGQEVMAAGLGIVKNLLTELTTVVEHLSNKA